MGGMQRRTGLRIISANTEKVLASYVYCDSVHRPDHPPDLMWEQNVPLNSHSFPQGFGFVVFEKAEEATAAAVTENFE